MKICHVITRMIIGGAQENTLLSCRGAIEQGHDVTLLTGPTTGPEGKLLAAEKCPGLRIVEMPDLVRELSLKHDPAAYRAMKRFFLQEKFDVVHTHASKAGIIGRIAARRAGVPLVVHTIHGLAFHPFQKPLKNLIYITAEKIAAHFCDRIYAVAQAMIDQCLARGIGYPELYQVVYSGMELDTFLNAERNPEQRKKLGLPDTAFVFATCARLFPEKGYEDFIPAAISVAQKREDVYFLLIGSGIMEEQLKKQVSDAGFADRFVFAGLLPPKEVPAALAQSDALVHLSLHEGLPRAAVQELAEAKPVIGYALDGTPEVVLDGKTGYLIAPRDLDAVEKAMLALAGDRVPASAMGKAGQDLVRNRFDWKLMSDALLKDYASSITGRKK